MFFVPIATMIFHREKTSSSILSMRLFTGALLSIAMIVAAIPARAVSLIRDPDIEYALGRVAEPVLLAAGLGNNVRVLIVNDRSLNAFVLDNNHIFINLGMLQRLDTPEKLQAVIAHEAAHITNGHISRRITNMGTANSAASLGLALAIAIAAAAGRTDVGAGLALGVTSAANRRFLAHTRAEESAADQTGVRYMTQSGIDPRGAVEVHEMFSGQELLNAVRQDPYVRSHPLSRDRVRAMQAYVDAYTGTPKPQPEIEYWFHRARGKASAFSRSAKWTLQRSKDSPTQDIRSMREAVAYLKLADGNRSRAKINQALELRPDDAFYYELKGQILLETRYFKDAVKAYERAVHLAPGNALCLAGYGRSLLAVGRNKDALDALERARSLDFRDPRLLRDLGQAYAELGQNGQASLATAERYALQGRLKDAEIHAKRASGLLPRGSSAWRRAEDIIVAAERAEQ